jgi:hypothetical protein
MNATKWTPGPWQIGSDFTTLAGDRKTTLWGSDGNQAVTLIQSGLVKWEEQADANANLIAAAPELYAALEDAFSDLNLYWRGDFTNRALAMKIQAALSKARGEEAPMHEVRTIKPR